MRLRNFEKTAHNSIHQMHQRLCRIQTEKTVNFRIDRKLSGEFMRNPVSYCFKDGWQAGINFDSFHSLSVNSPF